MITYAFLWSCEFEHNEFQWVNLHEESSTNTKWYSRFGELLREGKCLLIQLQGCIVARKRFAACKRIFKGNQHIKICAKRQDRLAMARKR